MNSKQILNQLLNKKANFKLITKLICVMSHGASQFEAIIGVGLVAL